MLTGLISRFRRDSLFRNSLYLMASTANVSGLGFVFWLIVAHWYSPKQVGISSVLLSAASLIATLSLLGLNNSIIRYLPKASNRLLLFKSSMTAVLSVSIIMSVIAIFLFPVLAPKISYVGHSFWLIAAFTIGTVSIAANLQLDSSFTALRSAKHVMTRSLLLSLIKLILPVFVVTLGAFGLFSAFTVGSLAAMLLGFIVLAGQFNLAFSPRISKQVLQPLLSFSAANYVVSSLGNLPSYVLPIMIATVLGATAAGYYYIAFLITGILFVIPSGVASALFAEGSHEDASYRDNIVRSLKLMYALLIPGATVICLFGPLILTIFGHGYAAHSTSVLRLLAISSFFSAFNYTGATTLNIRHDIGRLITVHIIEAAAVLGSVWLLVGYGLAGVGLGWLLGQAVMSVSYIFALGLHKNRFSILTAGFKNYSPRRD